jgi:hypothetical protein
MDTKNGCVLARNSFIQFLYSPTALIRVLDNLHINDHVVNLPTIQSQKFAIGLV